MSSFAILETEDGLTVVEVPAGKLLVDVAEEQGGLIVDETLFESYEDAYDFMMTQTLVEEDEDRA